VVITTAPSIGFLFFLAGWDLRREPVTGSILCLLLHILPQFQLFLPIVAALERHTKAGGSWATSPSLVKPLDFAILLNQLFHIIICIVGFTGGPCGSREMRS
jgi:hypothetical protein